MEESVFIILKIIIITFQSTILFRFFSEFLEKFEIIQEFENDLTLYCNKNSIKVKKRYLKTSLHFLI